MPKIPSETVAAAAATLSDTSQQPLPDKRYDLVIFGATGFTGAYVCRALVAQLATFASSSSSSSSSSASAAPKFTWAIASRTNASLEKLRDELREQRSCPEALLPAIITANVDDAASLERMCLQSRVLLNCVGPYAFLGEPVVLALLRASSLLTSHNQPGVDYADLCGEPMWIERMVMQYHERALALGITLVFAAGFDSIPADLGTLYAKRLLEARRRNEKEKVYPTSVEMFFTMHVDRKKGFGIHYATYEAAINGFATRRDLAKQRKQLYANGGLLATRFKPRSIEAGLGAGMPKRKGWYGNAIIYAEEQGKYLIPFIFADPSIIRLSQALDAKHATGVEPVLFQAWITLPSLSTLLIAMLALSLFGMLADREWGRRFLRAHPKLCSVGLVSTEGPTQEQLDASGFTTTLVARGHSSTLIESGGPDSHMGPDEKVTVKVNGPEVGYVTTPAVMLATAKVLLTQRNKVRKGTLTPAVALAETTIIEDLNKQGTVTFSRAE